MTQPVTPPTRKRARWRVALLGVCAAALVCLILAGCLTDARSQSFEKAQTVPTIEPGTLTVACDLVSPPMNFTDSETGTPRGFEYDLVCAIAERLGLQVSYTDPLTFSEVDNAVLDGRADLGASSIALSDLGNADGPLLASDPYMGTGRSVITLDSQPFTNLVNLNAPGVTVAVQQGSPNEVWARQAFPNAEVVYVPEAAYGLAKVANGTYDCAVYDSVTAQYLLNNVFSQLQVVYEEPDVSQFVFVAADDRKDLIDAVNGALRELERDGTLTSLRVKWFGTAD